jgi:hypothetical protein
MWTALYIELQRLLLTFVMSGIREADKGEKGRMPKGISEVRGMKTIEFGGQSYR